MGQYVKPEYEAKKYTCPYCETVSGIKWLKVYTFTDAWGNFNYSTEYINGVTNMNEIGISSCEVCNGTHLWYNKNMVIPEDTGVAMPAEDMPESVKDIYEEARIVYPKSSRAAAALLRLALQKLCKELGYKGHNINDDIAEMVKSGLSPTLQKVLDIIRVTGNEAVHPGTIDFNDDSDIALRLFEMLNMIVHKMITEPKEIDELYSKLPSDKLVAISKRDGK